MDNTATDTQKKIKFNAFLMKSDLKKLVTGIRDYKKKRKTETNPVQMSEIQSKLRKSRDDYRHLHIAYCELRGRKREEIEKPTRANKVNEKVIKKLKKNYSNKKKVLEN